MIFHSSVSAGKDLDKKSLTTFLYGSVLYIILHALLSTSDRPFFKTIQQYFWIIFSIDIICMAYIYFKLIQKNNPADQSSTVIQSLRTKLGGLLDNFIDTSMYSDDTINLIEYPASNRQHPPSILKRPQDTYSDNTNLQEEPAPTRTVSFNDTDDIREIEPNPVEHLHTREPIADNIDEESISINRELLKINNELYNPSKPLVIPQHSSRADINSNDLQRNIMQDRAIMPIQPKPTNGADRPPELQASSIDSIRRKIIGTELPASQLGQMNTKSLLENKTNLTNDQLSKINLNYNPDELVADIFKKKPGQEPKIGLATSTIKPAPVPAIKKNDDTGSSISNNSDLGSMLDFDMNEFAQSLS